jgi:hypothetical protein
MKIPRCAPSWLFLKAKELVRQGCQYPDQTHVVWLENTGLLFYWKHTRAFSALAFFCENALDERTKMEVLDAFSALPAESM